MKQSGLADFGGGDGSGSSDRQPTAEAEAIAGDGGLAPEVVDTSDYRYPDADGVVEIAVTQVDYTIEGSGRDEHPVLHVFGRTADDEVEHVRVREFPPYFYTPIDSLDHEDAEPPLERHFTDGRLTEERLTGLETRGDLDPELTGERAEAVVTYESIRGEELVKVTGQTPRDVGQLRDRFDHYEADILFPNRLLIDKDVTSGLRVPDRRADDGAVDVPHQEIEAVDAEADLRVNTFDIEVDDRSGFPEDGEEPIVCLTSHDSYRDEYVAWLYEAPDGEAGPDALAGYDPLREDPSVEVRRFDDEEAMLAAFLDYIRDETDPDVITGWNCLPGDSEVLMADGTSQEIQNVQVGDEVVGNEDQQATVTEVTNKWESEKEILEFQLADGGSLRSSEDHRIMVGDDERVDWKEGREIETGDYVLKPRKLNVEDETVPELSDLVPIENQRFADEKTVKEFKSGLPSGAVTEFAERLGVTKGTLYHPNTSVWTPERCEKASVAYDVPLPDGGREYRRSRVNLDRELTERELYLAGLILTDGTMSPDDGIRFYNTREELHGQFPGENHLQPDGKSCYKQNVLDWATMHAFNGLGIPFGNKNEGDVDLSTIYELPEDLIARFLAGVIDGDGNVSSSVTVAAENRSIGEWYAKLFRRLGIYASQRENVVRLPDAERDLRRLKRCVLPHMNHSGKVNALETLEGGKSGRTENIPYALFEADRGSDAKRIGRDKHRRGIHLKRHETTVGEWNEYVFVAVEDIQRTGTETTYDIETTTHNFVAENCLVHNCDDFDVPYLIDRLEVLGGGGDGGADLDPDRLSRVDEVWRSDWQGPNVKGRVVFDLLYAYKRTQFTELDSYRLDAVGEVELGVGKERYPGDIGDLWEDDPERLLEYNLRDVELCVELDRKQSIVPFWEEVASFVGCKLEDATTPGDAVDMYILHKVHGEYALPSKGTVDAEDYEGGAVFDPITGVKRMVSVLDLASLYPMCMVTINASPETKVDPDSYGGETYVAPNGMQFRKEPDGIIREMVTELLTERQTKKDRRDDHEPGTSAYEIYDRQQSAVKVIMNSLYGVLGWDRFRLYDKEMGAAVTATGRKVIQFTEEIADENGLEVVYGDSVTGDRPVVTRDPDGMVRIVPIEELFERAEASGAADVVITADGGPVGTSTFGKERGTLDGWEALSLSEDGESEWRSIEQVIRHRTDEQPVTLQHKFGESTTTRDHSYVVEEADELVERPPEAVDEPLRVPDMPEVDTVETIDVYEVLEGYTRTYEDGRSVGSEAAIPKTKRVHADDQWVWFGHESQRSLDSTIKVQRYVERGTPEFEGLLRLLGAYVTEGSASTAETTDTRFGASISESNAEWLEGLREDYQRLFENVTTSIVASDRREERTLTYDGGRSTVTYDDGTQKLQMMNELSAVFFREFTGQTSHGKRIPSFVFHLPPEDQDVFLETVVEGDGSREFPRYSEEDADRNFDFETTSRELAAGLSMLLTQRGEKHSLKYRDEKASYTIRTCDYYRPGRDPVLSETDHDGYVYDLSVAKNQNFVDGVGGIVLHNTDSVMIELGDDVSKDEAMERSFDIERQLNASYDDLAAELNADSHRFEIEFEKLYRRFFQAGKKKRYAGHIVWKEGKDVDDIDITGFEYKRSDIAPITKEVQQRVLEMIVTSEGEGYREDVKEYVHDVIERFRSGDISVEEVGIPGGIGKRLNNYDTDTAHVRGAKYANLLLGTNFGRGSKPKRIYLGRIHNDFYDRVEADRGLDARADPVYKEFRENEDVICIEYDDQLPEEFEVDWDAMLEKTIKGPIERVLDAIGISWDEVESGQTQTGLGHYA